MYKVRFASIYKLLKYLIFNRREIFML